MRNAIMIVMAMAVAGCARSQMPPLREVHAPPGWESSCFPVYFEFVGETDIVSDKSRELLRVMEGALDRVEVSLSPKLSAFDGNPANLTVMIPPEQVEADRVAFETSRTVVC